MKTMRVFEYICIGMLVFSPVLAATPRFDISIDGTEVTDQKTGLIWRRCAEGMIWNTEICTATELSFTHEQALSRAKTEAASSGKAWRLPNVKELAGIVDQGMYDPAINSAFPGVPVNLTSKFWTSTPYVSIPANAWYVDFKDGYVGSFGRSGTMFVRLVRSRL